MSVLAGVALAVYVNAWFAVLSLLLAAGIAAGIRQRARFQHQIAVLADDFVR
jgi:hypothetical protein